LFGVVLKCVLLLVFFRITIYVFPPFFDIISPIFFGLGFISFVFGAIGAFSQSNLRKFLAYTSISHVGIIVICFSTMDEMGFFAAFQYLATYVIASSIVFYLLSVTKISNSSSDKTQLLSFYSISELRFFKESSMLSSILLTLAFLSMAGIAPLAGF
jgi:NADH:ubiquinone oxidoreductase subunit 2 (subunit N)